MQAGNLGGHFEFHLVGEYSRELEGTPNLVFHGPYGREEFAGLVRAVAPHFGAVLSIWAETFCHTLTEMWACGLPVVAFDLGAVGDRIRRHGGGWLVGAVTPDAMMEKLAAIAGDAAGFEDRLGEVLAWQRGPGALETCAWMADAYDGLYRSLLNPLGGSEPRANASAGGERQQLQLG
jgi:glycosyltransferase involved in cell wall biosynthesis